MTRILRHLFMETLIWLARLTERLGHARIPVFVYHSIDESGTPIALSPPTFEQHLNYLRKHKYKLLSAGQAIKTIQANSPTKCAVLTFDDAYITISPWIENLLAQGDTATVFVPSSLMGQSNRWDSARTDIAQIDIMEPEHLRSLHSQGCEIGAHTQRHPNLTQISTEELKKELYDGRQELQHHLKIQPDLIAYPYGAYNDVVKAETKEAGYCAGFTTQLGYLTSQSDILAIPRFPTNIDFQLFRLIVHGRYSWYRKLQDRIFGSRT
ncbi:MAG: peptidoglycan/xylan/chitin deacetylase (PgdA/CDA1 family) [Candidatus Latescibacterota bacterium]|jgi:peptidoglycan/xylan/chitin deacetylase (PgdA/CDA1 family)